MTFRWRPGDPPPAIEEHSKAKLTVLRRYLQAYFERLSVNPSREEFKLDLVDGFSGGGTFNSPCPKARGGLTRDQGHGIEKHNTRSLRGMRLPAAHAASS